GPHARTPPTPGSPPPAPTRFPPLPSRPTRCARSWPRPLRRSTSCRIPQRSHRFSLDHFRFEAGRLLEEDVHQLPQHVVRRDVHFLDHARVAGADVEQVVEFRGSDLPPATTGERDGQQSQLPAHLQSEQHTLALPY